MAIIYAASVRVLTAIELDAIPTFFVVDNLALVVLCHIVRVDTGIANVTVNSGVVLSLVRDGLEERRAARARAPKNQAHLTWFEEPGLPVRPITSAYTEYRTLQTLESGTNGCRMVVRGSFGRAAGTTASTRRRAMR